jgi:hypothetical protein
VLSLPELVEGELRLYQQCDVVERAHHLVLMFLLTEAWWKMHDWIVMPAAHLRAHP